ncbi:MAG: hydroxymethylbilane synthase [Bacteroidetes bacterium]|nr:hydroxymethylbilane synthase [Bacteroidota bacterium]
MPESLIIGTRGSELALWQARRIQSLLSEKGISARLEIIKTQGDQIQNLPLSKLEGKGFFTRELEEALLDGRIDLAVHSMKDLPTDLPAGLKLVAVPERESPADRFLIHRDAADPSQPFGFRTGARVGTSSNRRIDQLRYHRPDAQAVPIRGNVPTRVQKLRDGVVDVLIMAAAGLNRLDLDLNDLIVVEPDLTVWVPAPAQGALAIECRDPDDRIQGILADLNSAAISTLVSVEREFLKLTGGGCHAAVGALAMPTGRRMVLQTFFENRYLAVGGEDPGQVPARALALHQKLNEPSAETVWLVRNHEDVADLTRLLEPSGRVIWQQPAIRIRYEDRKNLIMRATRDADESDLILFTSHNAVFWTATRLPVFIRERQVLAIGPATARAARDAGFENVLLSSVGNTRGLVTEWELLPLKDVKKVFYPVSAMGDTDWIQAEPMKGIEFRKSVVYWPEALELPDPLPVTPDVMVVYSASAVPVLSPVIKAMTHPIRLVSIGPKTTAALREQEIRVDYEALYPSVDEILTGILGS